MISELGNAYFEQLPIEYRALLLAEQAHRGQLRKYTFEPYITHPIWVAAIIERYHCYYFHDATNIATAYLHDVIEDTQYTFDDIKYRCDEEIAQNVLYLTEQMFDINGKRIPRIERKKQTIQKLRDASTGVQLVKVADMIHNIISIFEYDRNFAKVFVIEAFEFLEVLTKVPDRITKKLRDILSYCEKDFLDEKLDPGKYETTKRLENIFGVNKFYEIL